MKVSYNWLKEYVHDMPGPDEVASALTMHSFEIEGVEKEGDDAILDVKVLPNRSHDCLSHYGIASEIASVCSLHRAELLPAIAPLAKTPKVSVSIDTPLCNRAVAVYISGVHSGESPDWLKARLRSIGQRPISSVVDITNYLMYAFGQPTHAFDAGTLSADKKGNYEIKIRTAKKGEKITLLNDKEYTLDQSALVIADKDKPLDVAGVMGGKGTGVSADTKDIILTLCNFDAVSVRKTSKNIGVRTDASQRFENGVSPYLIDRVLPYALKLIVDLAGGEVVGGMDVYPKPQKQTVVTTTEDKISAVLGKFIGASDICALLARQAIQAERKGVTVTATIPYERLDIERAEDLAEEVGRIYGYENIPPVRLAPADPFPITDLQYTLSAVRKALVEQNFSEIYTYAFTDAGDMEIENPLAGDKKFLRRDLTAPMEKSLEHNFKYLDLLDIKEVKLFEIGKIFRKGEEHLHLSLGVKFPKGKRVYNADEEVSRAIAKVESALGISIGNVSVVGGIAEINLDAVVKKISIPENVSETAWWSPDREVSYKPVSQYPYAVRDVAVFVPTGTSVEHVQGLIAGHTTGIVTRLSLFDTFIKTLDDGSQKTSYAFRLIFQSYEKTLTEEEVNAVMNPIYETLKSQENFEIR